ncbi:MAG TPA: zf-HC2 domain-containing protein [Gemmatimonadaceae bacterium]|nr:zf-HC2 domain-containing protein [Gemmatimonadaceae bacterium]
MTTTNLNCEEFDALFSDYLEGTMNAELRTSVERHLGECVRCTGLVKDIDRIRKEASALPDLVPSRDLWAGIESRIAAPVVPLVARPAAQRRFTPAWLGVAAAALIVSTAGITYMLTTRSIGHAPSGVLASATPAPSQTTNETRTVGAEAQEQVQSATPSASSASGPSRNMVSRQTPAQSALPTPAGNARLVNQNEYSDVVYSREIAMLQAIVRDRRSQLDSGTVAIIERNLRIIDAAIAQSKAALARDPASQLLGEQLTHALDKKVELLRTAAMLPLST